MTTYKINYTNKRLAPLSVDQTDILESFSVNFPGRVRLEWGEDVNENLLHLLENFAVDARGSDQDSPDHARSRGILGNPVKGQMWFNKTNNRIYSYTGSEWIAYAEKGQQYAANWGQISHAQSLPLPVSPEGYVFSYDECIWSVSPFSYYTGFGEMRCHTDPDTSVVTMTYENLAGQNINGVANYMIIGIQRNINLGTSSY